MEHLTCLYSLRTKSVKRVYMKKIRHYSVYIFIIFCLLMGAGCAKSSIATTNIGLNDATGEHTDSTTQSIQDTSLNSENSQQNNNQSTLEVTGPEIVDNLKRIDIENLNDKKNSKVLINLPYGWYAKELIFDKASNFEFNAEKNRQIKKIYSFEFYNSMKMDKFNQYGVRGLAGEFYSQGYYRDQPESSRFPNHSQVKSMVYTGKTMLGEGEIFILDCDLPKEMRTDEFTTYDMVYAWIPIENEALAYNLSISVPLGEKDVEYIEMVKTMLRAK